MWLLLHGFTGAPSSWDAVLAARGHRADCLTPALLGHGHASRAGDSFASEADRISEMACALGAPRLIAGYSLGARVALVAVARHPECFDGALLIGVHPGLGSDEQKRQRRHVDAARATLLRNQGLETFIDEWEKQPLFASQRRLDDALLDEQRRSRSQHDAGELARSLEVLGLAEMPDCSAVLRDPPIPVTLVVGAEDDKFVRLAEAFSGSPGRPRIQLVPDCGHNVALEAPDVIAVVMSELESEATSRLLERSRRKRSQTSDTET